MMPCRQELLQKVYETGFALDDILLYLDTHPTDPDAMNYYRCMQQANQDAVRAYTQAFGPLQFDQVDEDHWTWIKSPWPWEGGNR